jgi:hypothetical protein
VQWAVRVYVRGQYGHMVLVTNGLVIPVLYRLSRLPAGEGAR